MKKVLQLVAKTIAAPFVVLSYSFLFLVGGLMSGWLWLFDKYDDLKMNNLVMNQLWQDLRKWLTTL